MFARVLSLLAVLMACAMFSEAFTVGPVIARSIAAKSSSLPSSSRPLRRQGLGLRMADPLYEEDSDESMKAPKRVAGKKGGISDSMRKKLLKENQALGGDPDAPSVNWAIVISVIVASLAVLGNLFGAF